MKEHRSYLATDLINAGFAGPNYSEDAEKIDLNTELCQNPTSTFYIRVQGQSMQDANIHNNDLIVVDKSLDPKSGNIVVAIIEGEFLVKRFKKKGADLFLVPENSAFKTIKITEAMDFKIWGVVTHTIHSCT